MIFFDTETCGLVGPVVLIQYAEDNGEIKLHSVWKEPAQDTLDLIEWMVYHKEGIVGFNLAFDWFQLQKMYNMLQLLPDTSMCPEDCVEELALIEPRARDGDCIRPQKACDLMLVARRGPYQSTMARKPIVIRRVPSRLAPLLARELEQRIHLPELYFARRKNKTLPQWQIRESKDRSGRVDEQFRDIVMDFKASSSLKAIANDLLGADRYGDRQRFNYGDIELPAKAYPAELGYAPFALALAKPEDRWKVRKDYPIKEVRGKYTWPAKIERHINHWHYGTHAREYARDDVDDTRGVWHAFDQPEPGDNDSELACMVASVRWRGYTLDIDRLKALREEAVMKARLAPRAPAAVRSYLFEVMTPAEQLGDISGSTKKIFLENIVKQFKIDCDACEGEGTLIESGKPQPCLKCKGSGALPHPACERAQMVLDARQSKKDIENYDKLILAGRFHVSLNVIGTKSSRMSGADGLNAQGIRKTKKFRRCFPLKHPGTLLCGGDFSAFEVCLAEASYNDADLRELLQSRTECFKCGGRDPKCKDCAGTNQVPVKVHALFGEMCFPPKTYAEILLDEELYTRSKSGFFSQIYGGNEVTLMTRLGVTQEAAKAAQIRFATRYPGVGRAQRKIFENFCSMRQPGGIGSKVEWHDPADYIENMLQPPFRRYFILENQICKALFDLANKPPKEWRDIKQVVVRRDREQQASGAVMSALYGAAFQIQAANMRAATNHVIQSSGAEITKAVELAIWEFQPRGVERWLVQPMNIHDEIEAVTDPTLAESVKQAVLDKVESYRPLVPLIELDWKIDMESWAGK